MFSSHEKFNPADASPASSQTLLLAQPLPLQQSAGLTPAQAHSWKQLRRGVSAVSDPTGMVWSGIHQGRTLVRRVGISAKPFPFSPCQENPCSISPAVSPSSPGQDQLGLNLPFFFSFPFFLQNTPPRVGLTRDFSFFSSLPDRPWLTGQQLEPTPYFGALLSAGADTAHLHPSPLKQM